MANAHRWTYEPSAGDGGEMSEHVHRINDSGDCILCGRSMREIAADLGIDIALAPVIDATADEAQRAAEIRRSRGEERADG